MSGIHIIVKEAAQKRILYTTHALKQMNSEKRLILTKEIENKIFNGHIIENYPEDKRGYSCLINGIKNLQKGWLDFLNINQKVTYEYN